jgi:hypothetical protein
MREKNLVIKFHNGITHEIPAIIVAENRADYYMSIDGYEKDSQEYLDEVNHALEDEFELFDWLQNSMSWDMLSQYIVECEHSDVDLSDEWMEGKHTISLND